MKFVKYVVFAVLALTALANIFPMTFRPLYDLGFGVITFGKFLGLVAIVLLVALIVKKEEV